MPPTFAEIEAIVAKLGDGDRARLRHQLAVTQLVPTSMEEADDAVANLQRVLDRIAVSPRSGTEMLSRDRDSRACTLSTLASG